MVIGTTQKKYPKLDTYFQLEMSNSNDIALSCIILPAKQYLFLLAVDSACTSATTTVSKVFYWFVLIHNSKIHE